MIQLKMSELTCMLLTAVGDYLHAPFHTLGPERGKYLKLQSNSYFGNSSLWEGKTRRFSISFIVVATGSKYCAN